MPLILPAKITRLHIPRHTRQPHLEATNRLAHLDLAAQPTRLRQPECQVQHVVFVVAGFVQCVVGFFARQDYVAGAAGAGAAAGAWVC